MIAVVLRRGNMAVPDWLAPLYLAPGVFALGYQAWAVRHLFRIRGRRRFST